VISGVLFPAALPLFHSFTLRFLRRRVEEWEKVRRIGVLYNNFWEFWHTKADGLRGTVIPLLPQESSQEHGLKTGLYGPL